MSDNNKEDVLELGCTGDRVRLIQAMLSALGYYSGPVDGEFGEQTARAVRQFQIVWELTSDGVAGPLTQDVVSSRFSNEFRETVRETPVDGHIPVPNSGLYRMPSSETRQDTPFSVEVPVRQASSESQAPVWKRWLVREE